jgi:hypothetical protein
MRAVASSYETLVTRRPTLRAILVDRTGWRKSRNFRNALRVAVNQRGLAATKFTQFDNARSPTTNRRIVVRFRSIQRRIDWCAVGLIRIDGALFAAPLDQHVRCSDGQA